MSCRCTKSKKTEELLIILLLIGMILVNIKSIFMDYEVDTGYAIAMAYRMVRGDKMFLQMWESHQTSAFLCAILIKLYDMLFQTTTGIVLYLHFMSAIIYGGVCYFFYKVVSQKIDKMIAYLMCIFLCTLRAKDFLILEFSNMQIMFSILLLACLVKYLDDEKNKMWLVLSALTLCAQVVSYPSCVVVFVGIIIILLMYSHDKKRNLLLLSAVCGSCGLLYVLYFIVNLGVESFLYSIEHIFMADDYHNGTRNVELSSYFETFGDSVLFLLFVAILSLIIAFVVSLFRQKQLAISKEVFAKLFSVIFAIIEIANIVIRRDRFSYTAVYFILIVGALFVLRKCNEAERKIVVSGMIISGGSFVATMLLTDLDFASIVRYLILAGAVSFISIAKIFDDWFSFEEKKTRRYILLILLCFVIIFRRGFMVRSMNGYGANLFDISGIVKMGPEIGIISDYMGTYDKNCSVEDWQNYVRPGDRLMLVGPDTIDSINHLYVDSIVSDPSTVSQPTFNEAILDYWDVNPEKYPNIIAVQCWYGDLRIDEDTWIMQWILNEFKPDSVQDGRYWRFYRSDGN